MTYHTDNKVIKCSQGYGFLFFAKKLGTRYGKKVINKGITAAKIFDKSKYGKALKKEGLKFAKTSGKQILEKAAPAVGDLIGNKIADKISALNNKPEEEIRRNRRLMI